MTQVNLNTSTTRVTNSYEKKEKGTETASSDQGNDTSVTSTPEDELVELADGTDESEKADGDDESEEKDDESSDSSSGTGTSKEALIQALMMDQATYTERLTSIMKRMNRVMNSKADLQKQINSIVDFDAQEEASSKLDDYTSTIESLKGEVSTCVSNLQNVMSQINQILSVNTTTATSTDTSVDGTSAASAANGVSATSATGAPAGYNAERGQQLVNAAKELFGDNPYSGGMCGYGVSCSISRAFGESVGGNGCDYKYLLEGRSGWKNVTSQYPTVESLDNLPAGAVVSWDPYNTSSAGSIYGHVYIADGNGGEISDFYATTAGNSHYANGGGWTVFIPV